MGKIKSAISGIGEFGGSVRYSVTEFEQAPLPNAGFLLTIAAMCMAIPTFIVSLVLAINNIQVANSSFMNTKAGISFLSAGTLYIQNVATIAFFLLFVAALVLFIIYKVKHPVRNGGDSINYEIRIWAIGALFSLVVAPLVLLFAENILTIVMVVVVCVVLFLFFSAAGNSDEDETASKGEAKERDNRPVKKVDKRTQVFRSGTILSGNGIFGYAGWPNDAFYICSESDYDKGKVRIVDRQTGKDHTPILPAPPKGAEAMLSKWERQ